MHCEKKLKYDLDSDSRPLAQSAWGRIQLESALAAATATAHGKLPVCIGPRSVASGCPTAPLRQLPALSLLCCRPLLSATQGQLLQTMAPDYVNFERHNCADYVVSTTCCRLPIISDSSRPPTKCDFDIKLSWKATRSAAQREEKLQLADLVLAQQLGRILEVTTWQYL